jgi:hypothetical protein
MAKMGSKMNFALKQHHSLLDRTNRTVARSAFSPAFFVATPALHVEAADCVAGERGWVEPTSETNGLTTAWPSTLLA